MGTLPASLEVPFQMTKNFEGLKLLVYFFGLFDLFYGKKKIKTLKARRGINSRSPNAEKNRSKQIDQTDKPENVQPH